MNKFLITNKNILKDYNNILLEYFPKTKKELQDIIVDLLKQGETDLNCIDVTHITDMSYMFWNINLQSVKVKDIDISEWDVSNVTNMAFMFWNCKEFNLDLSKWDVSNVNNMMGMFIGCRALEKNNKIPKWYNGDV